MSSKPTWLLLFVNTLLFLQIQSHPLVAVHKYMRVLEKWDGCFTPNLTQVPGNGVKCQYICSSQNSTQFSVVSGENSMECHCSKHVRETEFPNKSDLCARIYKNFVMTRNNFAYTNRKDNNTPILPYGVLLERKHGVDIIFLKDDWKTCACKNMSLVIKRPYRKSATSLTFQGNFLLCGGKDITGRLQATCFILQPGKRRFSVFATMNKPRSTSTYFPIDNSSFGIVDGRAIDVYKDGIFQLHQDILPDIDHLHCLSYSEQLDYAYLLGDSFYVLNRFTLKTQYLLPVPQLQDIYGGYDILDCALIFLKDHFQLLTLNYEKEVRALDLISYKVTYLGSDERLDRHSKWLPWGDIFIVFPHSKVASYYDLSLDPFQVTTRAANILQGHALFARPVFISKELAEQGCKINSREQPTRREKCP